MPNCNKCDQPLRSNDAATYGGVCEDCFCSKRTHKKHYKVGGDKEHSTRRTRGHVQPV
jgi:hypothetical protein